MADLARNDVADEDLAREAARGSVIAFEELAFRYERRIYSFLRRRCSSPEDLEDLTQATFVEAWKSMARYSPQWRFSTWVFTIATRQLTGLLRRRKVHERAIQALASAPQPPQRDPSEEFASAEDFANVWSVAGRVLDPEHHLALWLRYAEEFAIADIARILDRAPVTTRVILFRARQTLRNALEKAVLSHVASSARGWRSQGRSSQSAHSTITGDLAHALP